MLAVYYAMYFWYCLGVVVRSEFCRVSTLWLTGCLVVIVVRMGGLAGYGFEKSSLQIGLGLHVTHIYSRWDLGLGLGFGLGLGLELDLG